MALRKYTDAKTAAIISFIEMWKISKSMLAKRCGMSAYTFKMKMLETATQYTFTDAEIKKLSQVLRNMAQEIVDFENIEDLPF